jgi:NAD(P)-dependent dehydrogenase (short-subunit alcohol dehydrogenase family)
MLLEGKNALVFAASGAIASAVSRRFADEGAAVFVSARDETAVKQLVDDLSASGAEARGHRVDATDADEINAYVDRVAADAGSVDVVFNGIGARPRELGYPAHSDDLSVEDFLRPIDLVVASQFLTARAAARHMKDAGHGVIVTLSTGLAASTAPFVVGVSAASGAIEAMTRSLAGEFGPHGVRVNCVRGSGMPESRTIQETIAGLVSMGVKPEFPSRPLQRPLSLAETAATVAFVASDMATGMSGEVVVL